MPHLGDDVRVGGRFVAGHDQELDRLGVGLVPVGGRCPAVGHAAAVRGLRQVEQRVAELSGPSGDAGEPAADIPREVPRWP